MCKLENDNSYFGLTFINKKPVSPMDHPREAHHCQSFISHLKVICLPYWGPSFLGSACWLSPLSPFTIFPWGVLSLAWYEIEFPLWIEFRSLCKCALWVCGPPISQVCALWCYGSILQNKHLSVGHDPWSLLIPARSLLTSSVMWCLHFPLSSAVWWGT